MLKSTGRVLSVSVGGVREFDYHGRAARSGIWKFPVAGRVTARGVNLDGDAQADRRAHGGFDKAIYAYAIEDYRWWASELGRELAHGELGENLTTEGVDIQNAVVGERWEVGNTVLEVSEPRIPCWRLGVRMGDETFPRRFSEAARPGTYLRIIREGDIGGGDAIRTIARPQHGLTIHDVFRIFTRDQGEAARLADVPQMSEAWRTWALKHVGQERATTPGCC